MKLGVVQPPNFCEIRCHVSKFVNSETLHVGCYGVCDTNNFYCESRFSPSILCFYVMVWNMWCERTVVVMPVGRLLEAGYIF